MTNPARAEAGRPARRLQYLSGERGSVGGTCGDGACRDYGRRAGGQGEGGKCSSDVSHSLKVKLKVRVDGLEINVSERIQADSKAFWLEHLELPQLSRERPRSCWWGLPGLAPDPRSFPHRLYLLTWAPLEPQGLGLPNH